VQKIFDQAAARYRYCGCAHVKVVAIFGVVLDLILIAIYLSIIAVLAIEWSHAANFEQETESARTTSTTATEATTGVNSTEPLSETTSLSPGKQFRPSQVYESYLVATVADALLAILSLFFLLWGMAKNKPNYLIPQICLAFVVMGVKILQLSKQASDGMTTPGIIAVGIVSIVFTLWFSHVIFLYRKYMKDRNAFIAAHTEY